MDIKVDKMADLTWQSENEVKQDQQTNKWFLSKNCLRDLCRRCPLWRCFSGGAFVAVPLWRLKMTKIKTFQATTDGRRGSL